MKNYRLFYWYKLIKIDPTIKEFYKNKGDNYKLFELAYFKILLQSWNDRILGLVN